MSLADASESITATVELWGSEPYRLLTMQELLDAGIPVFNMPEGYEPKDIYVKADWGIVDQLSQRLAANNKPLPVHRIIVQDVTLTQSECPYCSKPEGWDACPVHRDGTPTTPAT